MSASAKLDEIRDGGQTVLALAFARLAEAEELLKSGRFNDAAQVAQEAHARIANLASAETFLAGFNGLALKRAEELTADDVYFNVGPIAEVEAETHHEGRPDEHRIVKITFENGTEAVHNARDECLVVPD